MQSHENSIGFMYSVLNTGSSVLTEPTHLSYLDPVLPSAFRGFGQWGMRTQKQSCYNWISTEQKHKLFYCGVGAVRRLICGCVCRFTLAHRHFLYPTTAQAQSTVCVCSCHKSLQHAEKHYTTFLSSMHTHTQRFVILKSTLNQDWPNLPS